MHRPLYRVIKEHKASFPEALIAEKGEKVKVGREDSEMPGWYWCQNRKGIEAWIPETHIKIENGVAELNQPYNSIEHNVEPCEKVQYMGESLGWTECLNREWRYGWIPSDKLESI